MEDNQSESYSESRIESLRKEVEVGKSQMLQLAYNEEQLSICIAQLNQRGCQCISVQQFYEAIVYLSEAQKVLEYAAGCGQTIDRTLILTTLHNQACAYQRIWQLPKSADYLEAIIYNTTSFLRSDGSCYLDGNNPSSQLQNKLSIRLSNQLHLISSHLQFCAVSSQVKHHQNALISAEQALSLLKNNCEELYHYEKTVGFACVTENEKHLLMELQNIRNFQNEGLAQTDRNVEKLLYKARKSIAMFQKKMTTAAVGLNRNEVRQLEGFSLGQLMQVGPVDLQTMQRKISVTGQLSYLRKIYKAIYISIAHFTMATELRLLANQRYGVDSDHRKTSLQFKESQVHHLVGLITVALYVPCYTKYFDHIMNSFKNHYQLDLTQNSDISHGQEDINKLEDDLIHLEIQSISPKDSESKVGQAHSQELQKPQQRHTHQPRTTDRSNISSHREIAINKAIHDMTSYGSCSSSEKSRLKALSRTARESQVKDFKKKYKSTKKKLTQLTSRQKRTGGAQGQKGKSKGKSHDKSRRGKSRKSVVECSEEKEKVVHYFRYDNKKVVRKKVKMSKEGDDYELTRKTQKGLREKRSPETIISHELKRINHFAQSTKELIRQEGGTKCTRKVKSPQLSSSRSHKLHSKRSG